MIWLKAEDVILLHSRIIQASGGTDGLRDQGSLDAALAAPLQSFAGQDLFPSPVEKIARLGYGLASNHAFLDGNKRIGATVVLLLLKKNGWNLKLEENELADMFISIADGSSGEKDLLAWLRARLFALD